MKYIETLLFHVKAGDWSSLAVPSVAILVVVSLAALPALLRALCVDPAEVLRAE